MSARRGTYKYTVWHKARFDGITWRPKHFTHHSLRVEIVEELAKQYRIKFLAYHEDGRGPGTIARASKDSVTLDADKGDIVAQTTVQPFYDSEGKPIREIKLPYKDD